MEKEVAFGERLSDLRRIPLAHTLEVLEQIQ
jgi:hypothetical protein